MLVFFFAITTVAVSLINRAVADPQVFAMDWPRWEYSVYMKWENTQEQRKEMVQYNNVTGLPACPGATDDY